MMSLREESRHAPVLVRNLLLLVGGIVLAAISLSSNGATRIYLWPWSFYTQVLLLIPLVAIVVQSLWLRDFRSVSGKCVDAAMAVFVLALFVSSSLSAYPRQAFEASLVPVFGVGLFYVVATLLGASEEFGFSDRLKRLQNALLVFAGMLVLVSLVSWGLVLANAAGSVDLRNELVGERLFEFRIFGVRNERPFGHGNYTAGMALLILPWFACTAYSRRGWQRVVCAVFAILTFLVLFSSSSRGGLVGFAAMLAGVLLFGVVSKRLKTKTFLFFAGVSLALLIGIGASNERIRGLVIHFATERSLNEGDVQRFSMLEAGWEMGKDRPLAGQGLGMIPRAYPEYRAQLMGGVETALQLHNTPVQIWATLGLPGAVLFILALVILAGRLRKALSAHSVSPDSVVGSSAWAAGLSLFGYVVFSLTDYQLDIPFFAGLVAVNASVVIAIGVPRLNSFGNLNYGVPAVSILALFIVVLYPSLRARGAFASAVDRYYQKDIQGFLDLSSKAAKMAPWEPYYLNATAMTSLEQANRETNVKPREQLTAHAAGLLSSSLKIDSRQEICHFNLGWMILDTSPAMAEERFRDAARLVPDKGGVYFGMGLSLLGQRKLDAADEAFALECINDPRFMTAPIWSSPMLKERRKQVLEHVHATTLSIRENEMVSQNLDRELNYVGALALWLAGDESQYEALVDSGIRSRSSFFGYLENADSENLDELPNHDWVKLARAWLRPEERSERIRKALVQVYGASLTPEREQGYLDLLNSQFDSLEDIFNAKEGGLVPLTNSFRRQRTAYGMLMKNMDGPTPVDQYIVEENGITAGFFSSLFPKKGYIPSFLLSERLSEMAVNNSK